jgi:hypothetical protein
MGRSRYSNGALRYSFMLEIALAFNARMISLHGSVSYRASKQSRDIVARDSSSSLKNRKHCGGPAERTAAA